jgi:tRNA pseudouridine55 synthase
LGIPVTDGILLVDKPAGPTSHDIVYRVRRAVGDGRVGHAGTLDPPASGLLVLLVGKATRLARFATGMTKRYHGVIRFGRETLTDDATGATRGEESDGWKTLTDEAVQAGAALVAARATQLPPAVSAKKIDGRRAYRIARSGEEPALEPAAVTISRLEIARVSETDFRIDVECSSGTYIRSIARDLGREVGVPAHLASLRRTGVGPWQVERAMPFDDAMADTIPAFWRPMSEAVAHLPGVMLPADDARRFAQGQKLKTAASESPVAVFAGGELIGIADVEDGLLKPDVVLAA